MKGKLFKRIVALTATIAMASQFALIMPAFADKASADAVYDKGSGFVAADTSGWTASSGTLSVDSGALVLSGNNSDLEASKTFTITQANPIIYYDINWNTATSTGRAGGYNYLKVGDFELRAYGQDQYATMTVAGETTTVSTGKTDVRDDGTCKISLTLDTVTNKLTYSTEWKSGAKNSDTVEMTAGKDYKTLTFGFHKPGQVNGINNKITSLSVKAETNTKVFHNVVFDVDGTQTTAKVENGSKLIAVDVPSYPLKLGGYRFTKWKDSETNAEYTTDELMAMTFTAAKTFVAQFVKDDTSVERMVSMEIKTHPDQKPVVPVKDENGNDQSLTYDVELSIMGEAGNDIAADAYAYPKGDLEITWEIDGFNSLKGSDTGEPIVNADGDLVYCDSYMVLHGFTDNATKGTIKLTSGIGNYFGTFKVKVKYGTDTVGYETFEDSFPLIIMADDSKDSSQIYPLGGYPENMNWYPNSLVGYKAYSFIGTGNANNPDPFLSGWCTWGGRSTKEVSLGQETSEVSVTEVNNEKNAVSVALNSTAVTATVQNKTDETENINAYVIGYRAGSTLPYTISVGSKEIEAGKTANVSVSIPKNADVVSKKLLIWADNIEPVITATDLTTAAEGDKYLYATGPGANSSAYGAFYMGAVGEQAYADFDVQFSISGEAVALMDVGNRNDDDTASDNAHTDVAYKAVHTTPYRMNMKFDGSALAYDTTNTVTGVTAGKWYRVRTSFDDSTQQMWYQVNAINDDGSTGSLLGKTDVIKYKSDTTSQPLDMNYFALCPMTTGGIKIKNLKIYKPEMASLNVAADPETVVIPKDAGNTATTNLTAIMKDADGNNLSGIVNWSLKEEYEGVTIEADEDDPAKAVVTVASTASPGEIVAIAANRGQSKEATVLLTGTADNVAFINPVTSVTIPFDDTPATATYSAEVRTGEGTKIDGKEVTYQMVDASSQPIANTAAISFDEATATLTVTKDALGKVVYIKGSSTNSESAPISKSVKVTIHGLSFDFGASDAEGVEEGYTAVTPSTAYTESKGYGIAGNVTAGGSATTSVLEGDYIENTSGFTFKANVVKGKNYRVTATYRGAVSVEAISSSLSGVNKVTNTTLEEKTFDVAVIDDVLDIKFAASGDVAPQLAALEIQMLPDKVAAAKPTWFTYGDSTTNSSSGGKVGWANVAQQYTDKFAVNNTAKSGSNPITFYNNGNMDNILLNIKPGDLVTFNGMGTNGYTATEAEMKALVDACEDRGAYVILTTYTPHGPVGNYTSRYHSDDQTFHGAREGDGYTTLYRNYAEKYGYTLIDFGKMGDDEQNKVVDAASTTDAAARETAAQAVIAHWLDHNHTDDYLADMFAKVYVPAVEQAFDALVAAKNAD